MSSASGKSAEVVTNRPVLHLVEGSASAVPQPAVPESPAEPESQPTGATRKGTAERKALGVTPPHPFVTPELPRLPSGEPRWAAPEYYLNRELTYLLFVWRVLSEGEDSRAPLLERMKFLAIVGSNLDEFFMKRLGGLKQQVAARMQTPTLDGLTPQQQIDQCYDLIRGIEQRQQKAIVDVLAQLKEHGVVLASHAELEKKDRAQLRKHYFENIFPLVTPQATDPAHPFPFVSNLSLNLLVAVRHPKEARSLLTRIKVPVEVGISRFLRVRDTQIFVPLEQVMAENLDLLIPDMEVESCELFRVTRNANIERNEEHADDLLALIESEISDRKFAPIVRLQIGKQMVEFHRAKLATELGLDRQADVFEVDGMIGTADLMELALLDIPEHHYRSHLPAEHPALTTNKSIFHIIREAKTLLLHHPYQSFATSVERFVRDASEDSQVRAIKMTLYRTSAESRIVEHLITAARNGKQVAVVVELKARFDEEANIRWASRLEEVGIHVTYGLVGLKTHCKVILVVRQEKEGLVRYAHIGTGNYHAGTARLYSDMGILTNEADIGHDLTELFNYLTTGYKPARRYRKIILAPKALKQAIITRIEREVDRHSPETPGHIQLKMNALDDGDVTRALYRAARAGVRIELIVRDSCRLRPGLPGITENVRVVSIVGRFLEHSRIFYFRNGGEEEYFIGSADCMKRNLESRVEAVIPIEDPEHRKELRNILDLQLADQRSGWDMRSDGSYVQHVPRNKSEEAGSQDLLIERADKQQAAANKLLERMPTWVAGSKDNVPPTG